MAFWDVPLDQIGPDHIAELLKHGVREGRSLDFKRDLPGNADREKRDFLADVTAFANTAGGDLVFGIAEDDGVAEKVAGIDVPSLDTAAQTLMNLIANGTDPRVQGVGTQVVDCGDEGTVLVLRIPRSWSGPHMVSLGIRLPFYARAPVGKHPMDMTELRDAYLLSATLPERIKRFRETRLAEIANNHTPANIGSGPKFVLHLIPLSAPAGGATVDIPACINRSGDLKPIYTAGWGDRFNFDGYLTFSAPSDAGDASYTQVFRDGSVEAVDTSMLRDAFESGSMTVPSTLFEKEVALAIIRYLKFVLGLGSTPPYIVSVSLLGVRGYHMAVDMRRVMRPRVQGIERDNLTTPDVSFDLLPESLEEVFRIMKPAFDTIWNAAGYASALSYDSDGNWVG